MPTNEPERATEPEGAAKSGQPPFSLIGVAVSLAVLAIILDFFDVGIFDGTGPGACLTILGLGLLTLAEEGLRTGALSTSRSFILRETFAPLFWISLAIYALAGIILTVIGLMTMFGPWAGL